MQANRLEPLGRDLTQRLRLEIDRMSPPATPAWVPPERAESSRWWRAGIGAFAPGALLVAVVLYVSLVVGSTNAGDWAQQAGNSIRSSFTQPGTQSPNPQTSAKPSPGRSQTSPSAPSTGGQVSGGQVSGGQVSGGQVSGGQVSGGQASSSGHTRDSDSPGQARSSGQRYGPETHAASIHAKTTKHPDTRVPSGKGK
jgi:hypothetical protein